MVEVGIPSEGKSQQEEYEKQEKRVLEKMKVNTKAPGGCIT